MTSTKSWAVVMALVLQGCGGCGTSPVRTVVSMDNNGPGEVHLWVEGEEGTFAPNQLPLGQGSKVATGGSRSFNKTVSGSGLGVIEYTVSVGQNGALLKTKTESVPSATLNPDWTETNGALKYINEDTIEFCFRWNGTDLTVTHFAYTPEGGGCGGRAEHDDFCHK